MVPFADLLRKKTVERETSLWENIMGSAWKLKLTALGTKMQMSRRLDVGAGALEERSELEIHT